MTTPDERETELLNAMSTVTAERDEARAHVSDLSNKVSEAAAACVSAEGKLKLSGNEINRRISVAGKFSQIDPAHIEHILEMAAS